MEIESIRIRIRKKREEAGYTQSYMAGRLCISTNSYRGIESGKTLIINKNVIEIAEVLNISLESLMFDSDSKEKYEDRLALQEKEYQKKIESITTQFEIETRELNEQIEELKFSLRSKNAIIGVLKEKIPKY